MYVSVCSAEMESVYKSMCEGQRETHTQTETDRQTETEKRQTDRRADMHGKKKKRPK